ncbi:MAG: formylglycine-generating enzyme family protein [Planctomycetota bacterium]
MVTRAIVLSLLVFVGTLSAQQPRPEATAAFARFSVEFGPGLLVRWDDQSGYARHIWGQAMDVGPVSGTTEDYERLARELIDRYEDLFGVPSHELELRYVKHCELSDIGTSDKTAVVFDQRVAGIPAEAASGAAASVSVIFNDSNNQIVSINNQALPHLSTLPLVSYISGQDAAWLALRAFSYPLPEIWGIRPAFVPAADLSRASLSWVFGLESPGGDYSEQVFVDAHTGEVIRARSTIHSFTDLDGSTWGWASPSVYPDRPEYPETPFPLQWVKMRSPIGSDETDATGRWAIPSLPWIPFDVTAAFGPYSRYAWVEDDGPVALDITMTRRVWPDTSSVFLLNDARTEADTSEVNAQRHIVNFREWVRQLDPTDSLMDFRIHALVNLPLFNGQPCCNAWADSRWPFVSWWRLIFLHSCLDQPLTPCPSTAYSSVIAHELGHFANVRYGSGNGPDGFGEGNADVWAMYIYDDSEVGRDWGALGRSLRTGTNDRLYCGTCGAGCYATPHENGEVHMGAFWKMRERLNVSLGDAGGDAIADNLFLSWMQAYDDDEICDIVRDHLLVLDDDDGNVFNGTPHGADIDGGFVDQGFPPFPFGFPPAMVLIPGGEFEMGDHHGEGYGDELPVHAVYIDAFWMDTYEVTNEEYCLYLNSAYLLGWIEVRGGVVYKSGDSEPYCDTDSYDSDSRIHWDGSTFTVTSGKEDHPMVEVSWYGAVAYANWRSTWSGLPPCYDLETWECNFDAGGFRLPTEAEWEKAARGGEHNPYYRYPWGNDIDGSKANYWSSGDPYENGPYPWTTPVGYYDGNQVPPGSDMANGYGLYDMAGNVWEWCNDWYAWDYYSYSPYDNPRGPAGGAYRVRRGGSWYTYDDLNLRCADRDLGGPGARLSAHGFRLALD